MATAARARPPAPPPSRAQVALKSLELQEALPPLDELQKFNAAAQVPARGARERWGCFARRRSAQHELSLCRSVS